ncbi:MAG: methyltransferase domain-containing protein [Candidatus Moraniibacteriota bacterium]|nr:MAG: methyltransferase domain-containing protein [Candidatus Moranbacteria bacterium]
MKKLHLGCGRIYIPGFIHIDLMDFDHIDYKIPADDLSVFDDDSVDLVYACHILEHFKRTEVKKVLQEWFRVLKPGGVLRLSVPGFEEIVAIYQKYGDLKLVLGPLVGGQTYLYNFHYMAFDFRFLSELLIEAGFKGVRRYDWRKTEHAGIDDYSQAYIPHMDKEHGLPVSLNVEAVK